MNRFHVPLQFHYKCTRLYLESRIKRTKLYIYMNPHEKSKYNVSMIGMLFHKIETSIKMNEFAKKKIPRKWLRNL